VIIAYWVAGQTAVNTLRIFTCALTTALEANCLTAKPSCEAILPEALCFRVMVAMIWKTVTKTKALRIDNYTETLLCILVEKHPYFAAPNYFLA
jgi:hypothetical protein